MRVAIFGATGMIGQSVLREALLDSEVERVITVGRAPTGKTDPKLHEVTHGDLGDLHSIEPDLRGLDACFFCLGVTSNGLDEAQYRRITYDFAVEAARAVLAQSPTSVFVHVSGAGADSTEKNGAMWARVKGQAENAILRMPFREVYAVRPGAIQPLHGIESRTPMYRTLYRWFGWVFPIARAIAPNQVTTTERLGRAMLDIAKHGAPEKIVPMRDLNAISDRLAQSTAAA